MMNMTAARGGGSSCRHAFPMAVVSPVRRLVSPSFGPAVVSPVDVVSVGGWSILIVGWVEMAGGGDGGLARWFVGRRWRVFWWCVAEAVVQSRFRRWVWWEFGKGASRWWFVGFDLF
ncbi:hypothetical protein HanOQP8_Chr16g0609091 [Helianthus annuus]|nr:hypothetical protein HanOQP8_Chr16g0609091 [Helianthus annuus]